MERYTENSRLFWNMLDFGPNAVPLSDSMSHPTGVWQARFGLFSRSVKGKYGNGLQGRSCSKFLSLQEKFAKLKWCQYIIVILNRDKNPSITAALPGSCAQLWLPFSSGAVFTFSRCDSSGGAAQLQQQGKVCTEISCKGQRTTWKAPESKTKQRQKTDSAFIIIISKHFNILLLRRDGTRVTPGRAENRGFERCQEPISWALWVSPSAWLTQKVTVVITCYWCSAFFIWAHP